MVSELKFCSVTSENDYQITTLVLLPFKDRVDELFEFRLFLLFFYFLRSITLLSCILQLF